MTAETVGTFLAALLTLMVFSYLVGTNPLYRFAQHLFVGVSLGYVAVVLLTTILIPRTEAFVFNPSANLLLGIPLLMGVMLLMRLARPGGGPGTVALNLITVTAAGLTLGGALAGTLVPQMAGTMLSLNPAGDPLRALGNLIIVLGVLASLYYFSFGVRPDGRRGPFGAFVAGAGRWLIIGTLGTVLGTLAVSFITALIDRIEFLFHTVGL